MAMKKQRTNIIFLILFFLILQGCGKKNAQYLAKVCGQPIRVDEFKERLEDFLLLSSTRDNLLVRTNILNNMISESLLLAEAEKQNIKQDPEYQYRVENIKKHVLLNAFRQNVIYDTITVSDKEIRKRFIQMNQRVSARHLYARTREEAEELLKQLRSGVSFKELAARTFHDSTLAANGGYLGYFGWGDMDPAFQKAAFSLKVGEISEPVKTRYGYSIIKVEDRFTKPILTEYEYQTKKEKLRKAIKLEKLVKDSKKLIPKIAKNLSIEFNPAALKFLASRFQNNKNNLFHEADFEKGKLDKDSQYMLQEELIKFKGGNWTIKDFLKQAESTSTRERNRVKDINDLKHFIQGLVIRETLVKEARKAGLDKNKKVQKSIDRQIKDYIIVRMRKEVEDTVRVPESAVEEHYQKFRDQYYFPEEVNIREILVESQKKAEMILKKIRTGEDFAKLARIYSIREWAAERGGELGYAPRGKFGALADTIFAMHMGEVIGPLKIGGCYSIIKLIGRKKKRQKTFKEAEKQIEAELSWKWKDQAFNDYLDKLKQKNRVEINKNLLRNLVLK